MWASGKKSVGDGGGVTLSAHTNLDSESNAMLLGHAYKAAVAGSVTFMMVIDHDTTKTMSIYVGATDDPVGAGVEVAVDLSFHDNTTRTLTALVAKDEYFECVRSGGAGTPGVNEIVLFKGFDTLGNPIDQD